MKTLPNNFYTMPQCASITMDRENLKELLLNTDGWVTARGEIYNIKNEPLGAGVYKVYLEKKH